MISNFVLRRLEEELKSKKDELMRSKKDTLQMQLDSLIKDNKTVGEFKRVQQLVDIRNYDFSKVSNIYFSAVVFLQVF